VATAAADGRVNLSPNGLDSLCILGSNQVAWLNVTGSGNETGAHLLENPRMTIMFCAFQGKPLTLSLYGKARAVYSRDADWQEYAHRFDLIAGVHQILQWKWIWCKPHAAWWCLYLSIKANVINC
jgi:hypothetical protein